MGQSLVKTKQVVKTDFVSRHDKAPRGVLAALFWEGKTQCLKNELYPAVGAQAAHADDFGTSGNDDGDDGHMLFGHADPRDLLKFSCSR